MTKDELSKWCGVYGNCYYYLFGGVLYDTGPCPFMCEELSIDVANSEVFEDVTSQAKQLHPQLAYEVDHNGCKLYKIWAHQEDIVICYFNCQE